MIFIVSYTRFLVISLITLSLSIIAGYFYYQSELKVPLNLSVSGSESSFIIEIQSGDSLNKVLAKLTKQQVLSSSWIARIYSKEKGLANKIKVGEFALNTGMTIPELFDLITSNQQIQYTIQFIEGTTFRDIQKVLAAQPKLRRLLDNKTDAEILEILEVAPSVVHLEGQFYPDTYSYHKNDTDVAILKRAHKRLQEILNDEWQMRQENLKLKTPYEALILASIVEKETGVPDERSQIAGVFLRRLEKNMRLQTDPTVIYGLGERYKGNLKRKHLQEHTDYNTYRIKGLPPTPIAMVGQAAIHATLHPLDGHSLYFVAKGDGTHHFSATIKEHNQAVRKYQLKRRSDYRSSQQR